MLLGYMPKREMLERYDVLQFHELACALKEGNIAKFDEVIQRHENFFIEYGIYLIVEKLKIFGYRNLFKRVSKYNIDFITQCNNDYTHGLNSTLLKMKFQYFQSIWKIIEINSQLTIGFIWYFRCI